MGAQVGTLKISYRTPFQRLPPFPEHLKYRCELLGLPAKENLPYGLDVWAPKKVLNIEWDDKGAVVLVAFRTGEWEAELIAATQAILTVPEFGNT